MSQPSFPDTLELLVSGSSQIKASSLTTAHDSSQDGPVPQARTWPCTPTVARIVGQVIGTTTLLLRGRTLHRMVLPSGHRQVMGLDAHWAKSSAPGLPEFSSLTVVTRPSFADKRSIPVSEGSLRLSTCNSSSLTINLQRPALVSLPNCCVHPSRPPDIPHVQSHLPSNSSIFLPLLGSGALPREVDSPATPVTIVPSFHRGWSLPFWCRAPGIHYGPNKSPSLGAGVLRLGDVRTQKIRKWCSRWRAEKCQGRGSEEQGAVEAGAVLFKTSCTEEGNLKKARPEGSEAMPLRIPGEELSGRTRRVRWSGRRAALGLRLSGRRRLGHL